MTLASQKEINNTTKLNETSWAYLKFFSHRFIANNDNSSHHKFKGGKRKMSVKKRFQ